MDSKRRVLTNADVYIEDNLIRKIGKRITGKAADKTIDCTGKTVIPGFVQTHIHLCQTLFRGMAEEAELLVWLRERVWPLEAMHTPETLYTTALLGIAELVRSGTTCILDMGTVNHTSSVFEAVKSSGIRATVGNAMMDTGDGIPAGLKQETEWCIRTSMDLFKAWHNTVDQRIRYAFTPRFALSCSQELIRKAVYFAKENGVVIHTHASENYNETNIVKTLSGGKGNVEYLHSLGVLTNKTVLAHCVWLNDNEYNLLNSTGASVAHCPSSNLKLGSGIASTRRMKDAGINVTIGTDGAPCNNNLNVLTELRIAGLLARYKDITHILSSREVMELATVNGAKALGIANEVGSIEVGKHADVVVLNLNKPNTVPYRVEDVYSAIVYSAGAENVDTTIIDGKVVYNNGKVLTINETDVTASAMRFAKRFYDKVKKSKKG